MPYSCIQSHIVGNTVGVTFLPGHLLSLPESFPPLKVNFFAEKLGGGKLSVPFQKLYFVRKIGGTFGYFKKIYLSI